MDGSKAESGGRSTHRSLARGLKLLEMVAADGNATTLAAAARRSGLHRSTAHHLLRTLVELGYLDQDGTTRSYRLSAKLFRITGRTWTPEQLGRIAEPHVMALSAATGEGASFAAYRAGEVIVAAKSDSDGPVRVVQDLGVNRPLHATAVSKAILAWLPTPELSDLLQRLHYRRFTPRTIVTRRALEAELARSRAQGCAIDNEEHLEGIRCIAAPVFGYNNHVLGSLCVIGPKSRMTQVRMRAYRTTLIAQAARLSYELDWKGP